MRCSLRGRIVNLLGFRCAWLRAAECEVCSDAMILLLLQAIKACSGSGGNLNEDLETGKRIHRHAAETGAESNVYVANSLINMYAKCGSLPDACSVFQSMDEHNVVSWNALVLAYALNGEGEAALVAIERMVADGLKLNDRTYVAGLKACVRLSEKETGRTAGKSLVKVNSLERGMDFHARAVKSGWESDMFVGNALVDMYSNCGSLLDARVVFDRMLAWDVVSWTSMIMGCAENGEDEVGLELALKMMMNSGGCLANARTYVAALTACAGLAEKEEWRDVGGKFVKIECLRKGMEVHSQAVKNGFHLDMFVASSLVNLYTNCGSLFDARLVFDRLRVHDVVAWTALLLGYVENGEPELVILLFTHIQQSEVCNSRTFVAVLMACSDLAVREEGCLVEGRLVKVECLEKGMALYVEVLKRRYESEVFVANALVDMFMKCGSLIDARRVFDRMPAHDVVSWSTLILGYAENSEETVALNLFSRMTSDDGCCRPSARTFVSALVACTNLLSLPACIEDKAELKLTKARCLETGVAIHSQAAECGCDSDTFVANTLIDLYVKCGSLVNARQIFDKLVHRDAVSWNALILGYAENGEGQVALELLQRMLETCRPTARTFSAGFQACAGLADREQSQQVDGLKYLKLDCLEKGMKIHSAAVLAGLDRSDLFGASALINMYGKCGSLLDARMVFDRLNSLDVVSLTALVLAYIENGESEAGLEIFFASQELVRPNSRTLATAVMACGSLVALEAGKRIHADVCRWGIESDGLLVNCLVDFYAKSGSMVDAEQIFGSISSRDPVIWSTMVTGFARQGETGRVFELVDEMVQRGVEVSGITLLSVLTSCSHGGLVDEGRKRFKEMKTRHGIEAGIEHYHCLIDMLGRVNRLDEALAVIQGMPFEPSVVTWTTVLAAAAKWKDVIAGTIAYKSLVKMNSNEAPAFMLMANLCGWENIK